MSIWRQALVAGLAAVSVGTASAALIVDTGAPPPGQTQVSLFGQGVAFQHLGLTFDVGADSSITSIEGFIAAGTTPADLLIELHDGNTPNGPVLFSLLVTLTGIAEDWRGATGLDWDVLAGDYTVTLTAQPGFSGGMPANPPNPAGTEWFINALSGGWTTTTFNIGWRINADAAVPEPAACSLALLALVAAGAARRRAQRSQA